ncbi:MAG TPA: hypothetical protein DIT40_08970 [Alphaproteobacteria bacterium]|nr:hypothetical protein [Alphaproteobacteria bacterium]
MFEAMAMYPKGEDDFELRRAGYQGRKNLQLADSFDVMIAKAASRGKGSPFTAGQIAIGRHYRDLVERHACAGVRGSSMETIADRGGKGGTGNSSFIDAVLRDREDIARLRRRIGDSAHVNLRKQRPSERGARVTITDRRLVDIVCLEDGTIADVLRAHGWKITTKTRKAAQRALAVVLDRMAGPVDGSIRSAHWGEAGKPIFGDQPDIYEIKRGK